MSGGLSAYAEKRIAVQPDGCWRWVGQVNSWGYGRVTRGGRSQMAHRFVWEQLIGPIPQGLDLDHLRGGSGAGAALG